MAGRIRSIKPEILEDEIASSLSDAAWRLWVSSWTIADDHGDLRAGSRYLGANVWQDTSKDVSAPLNELISKGRFIPYAVRGQRYVRVANWAKHQRVDNAGDPRIPTPEQDDGTWDQEVTSKVAENRGASPTSAEPVGGLPLAGARAQSGGETTISTTTTTTTTSPAARGRGDGRAVDDGRGTRIRSDWKPKDETVEWAAQQGVDASACLEEFVEYWQTVPGTKGRRANWDLVFRNRIRDLMARGRAPEKQPEPRQGTLVEYRADGSKLDARTGKPIGEPRKASG